MNLRDTLALAMKNNPRGSEREHRDALWADMKADPVAHAALFDYWFKNTYRHYEVEEVSPNSIAIFQRERATSYSPARHERRVIRSMKAQIKAVLLDHVLTNGKKLRDATFGDCAKDGGWLMSIAKQGKPNEIVGRKLTENDIQNLMKRAA